MKNFLKFSLIFSALIFLLPINDTLAEESVMEMEGEIRMVDQYSPNASHGYQYFLFEESSQAQYKLNLDNLSADWTNLNNKKVAIKATQPSLPDGVAASNNAELHVTEMSLMEQLPSAYNVSPATPPASLPSVTLLSKFADISAEPHNVQYFQNRFYDDSDSLRQFYLVSSYDQFSWSGSASDWKTVSQNQLNYRSGALPNFNLLVTDAIAIHDPTVNFSGVTSLILVYNDQTAEGPITVRVTWEYDEGTSFPVGENFDAGIGVTAHELGHNVEFDHTPAPPGNWLGGVINDPYHDPWSVMSTNADFTGPSGLVMGQRDQVGWVASNDKVTIPQGTSSTVTLDYINQPASGPNPHMALVPLPSGNSYIIEAHTNEIFNDTPLDNEGIMVYNFFPSGNQYDYLTFSSFDKDSKYGLVATSGTNTELDFRTANLDVGETYTDANNVTISTLSKTATSVTVLISNDAAPSTPTLSINDIIIAEGDSGTTNFDFTITRSGDTSGTSSVSFATADGTATASSDYIATSGTVSFASGVTQQTITIIVNGDTEVESDETFTVILSSPVDATITDAQGLGTIQNDDTVSVLPTLSINDIIIAEGDSGTTNFDFTITRSGDTSGTSSVSFATADGTATASSDYITTSGTASLGPGVTQSPITIVVNGDTEVESDETFTVTLSSPVGATITDAQGLGTIQNDDSSTGTISGIVFNDTNGNGIQDTGEIGIVTSVYVLVDPLLLTTTDSTGAYSFTDVASGTQIVQVVVPAGFVPSVGTSFFTSVTVTAGQTTTVNFPLEPVSSSNAATVSGTVFTDVNGNQVFDPEDTGIAGYQLFAISLLSNTIEIITTDSTGQYAIEISPAPDVTLMNSNFFPAGTTLASPAFFQYIQAPARGAALTFDLAFKPVTAGEFVTLNITTYNDVNNNGVRDSGEPDFPNVNVQVFTFTTNALELVTTDSSGVATKSDLVPADWQAQVLPPAGFIATSPIDSITTIPGVLTADDPAAGSTFTMDIGLFSETATLVDVTIPLGTSTPGCETTNSCYLPNTFTVAINNQVTWRNDDTAAHTVTSGDPTNGADGLFDSSLIASGSLFSFTFSNSGTFPYYCTLHPWMTGTIVAGSGVTTPVITSPTTNSSFEVNESFTIIGTSDANALIELFVDEVLVLSTTADSSGNWSFTNFSISTSGSHTIAVDATVSGSTAEGDSITLIITDVSVPLPPVITSPVDGATIERNVPFNMEGTSEPNATIRFFLNGVEAIGSDGNPADSSGNWSFQVTLDLSAGQRTLGVTQTTSSGTSALANITVTVVETPIGPLTISSSAFANNGVIPTIHADTFCGGTNVSPPLEFSGIPSNAVSLALTMEDFDAIQVIGEVADHWLFWNLPPTTTSISQGETLNAVLGLSYIGPCPPTGNTHDYSFTLYALDTSLTIPAGSTKATFLNEITDNIIEQVTLIGKFTGT